MNNEPVAWLMVNRDDGNKFIQMGKPTRDDKVGHEPYPLYTHPANLTDEEVFNLEQQAYNLAMQVKNQQAEIEALKDIVKRFSDQWSDDFKNFKYASEEPEENRLRADVFVILRKA